MYLHWLSLNSNGGEYTLRVVHSESWNSTGGWIGFSDFWIPGHFFNVLNCWVYDDSKSSISESSWLKDNSSSLSLHYKMYIKYWV